MPRYAVKITESMERAAVEVFRHRDAFDFYDDGSLATIASEVYEAMALAAVEYAEKEPKRN
jgi:hypothetical protein